MQLKFSCYVGEELESAVLEMSQLHLLSKVFNCLKSMDTENRSLTHLSGSKVKEKVSHLKAVRASNN